MGGGRRCGAGPDRRRQHGDAGALAAHLCARDQSPDPELARKALRSAPNPGGGDHRLRERSLLRRPRPGEVTFLAGIYAFGATLAIAIAHLSIIRLRTTEPERERPYKVPLPVRIGSAEVPLPAAFGALVAVAAWVSVFALHRTAIYIGGGWMAAQPTQ